ncbi:MAG: hypothetical protein LC664_06355 [Flavobacteriales bacterium]|nr:hypothetical protein [Flavobacteriales bacterium]
MRLLLTTLLALPFLGYAQNEPAGARAAGMANAALNYTDIWSTFQNQAGIAGVDRFSAGAFYENKFGVRELAYTGFAAASPLGNGAIALSYTNFGFDVYREGKLGLAYGMKLSDGFSVGVQLNHHTIRISAEDYGSRGAVTAEVGFRLEVSEKVSLGAHIFNPSRTKLNSFSDERIPTLLRFGAQYTMSEDLIASAEVEKDIDRRPLFRAGLEYQPAEVLFVRMGTSSEPMLFAFGMGLNFETFKFDLAATYHSIIGYSPQVSLTFAPDKK